jgi:hypothetical protein
MPTSSFNKFQPFVENLAEKVFNLGSDQITVALSSGAPTNTWSQLSSVTEISYTNLSTRNVTTTSSAQTTGTYKLVLQDLTLTASGGSVASFRYVILYDNTATNDELIGYYDYGSSVTLADGESLLLDFDGSAGVLTIA